MSHTTLKGLSLAAAIFMIVTGLGVSRWIVPHQQEWVHHLTAAGGQLAGFAALCVIALHVEEHRNTSDATDADGVSAHPGDAHPLHP